MNILKKNILKSRFHLTILFVVFSLFVFLNKEYLFRKFDSIIVESYLRSQDILDTENKIKDRIFVSDEEIYIASGFLYANGASPTEYNFQHPPFIKYLYGLSAKYFNLPLLPNIIFSAILLSEVYLLGKLVFKSGVVGLFGATLLLIDPVFKEITIYGLLDLGQVVFLLGFILTTFFWKKHWIGQGVLLGLAIASKFYSPVIMFLAIIYMYKIVTKQFDLKRELFVLVVASISLALTYTISFLKGDYNFLFHQAKIIKFMLDHNRAIEWGGAASMFFGGYYLWPISFFVTLFLVIQTKVKELKFLLLITPVVYMFVMLFQLPFTRYFILILPFLYLSLSKLICEKLLH
ncbi:MAG: hypothetical protein QY322_03935 [bacterium]|nr:MAG: hypothetical protein QY322_03935 [bacterium]